MNNFAELVRDLYGKYAPDVDINEKFKYIVDNDLNVDDFVKEFYGKYAPEENLQEKQDYIFKNYFPDQYNVNTIKSKPKEIDPSDFENTQEKNTFLEDWFGKGQVTDFFGDFIRAGKSGWHGGTSVNESFDLFKKGKNMTDEEVVELVKRFREMEGAGQTDEMLAFSSRFEKLKEKYGGIGGTLAAWWDNPTVMAQYTTQSLVQMAASAIDSEEVLGTAAASSGAGALAGAGAGAALTSVGGPFAIFGAGAGGIGGGIGGFMGGLSGAMETGLTTAQLVQETAEEQGLNWATMTDEERIGFIRKATNDEKSFNDIKSKALARGITIGAIDGLVGAVSAGAGKTIFSGVAKTSLSKAAGLAATGGIATLETAGGMASEYFGQKAAGQEYNLEEIMIEGFADKTFTGIQAVKSLNQGVPKYTLNGQKLNGKEFSNALKIMDDEAYVSADIKIENSPGVQKLVDNRKENISIDQDINSKISDVNDRSEAIELEKQKRALENNKTESGRIKLAQIKNKISELEKKYENSKIDVSIENRKKAVANALDTKFEKQFNKNLKSVQELADQKGLNIDINENEDTYFQKIADATGQTLEQIKEKAVGSDGAFVGKGKIFINKTQAKKIGAVNVASHEVLHPVLNALVGGTKAQQNLVNGFKNKLNSKQRSMMDKFMGTQPEGTEYLTVFTDNFDAIMAEQNITQKISDFFRNMYVKLGYENINFESGEGIYNFLKEYSKSTREGKLSDRATQAIDKAEAKVDTKIGDVETSSKIADFSKTSKEAKEVNDIYNSTANKTEAGFNIAMKYRGMAENTFKSIRDGGNYTQDQIDKLNENKDDIIAMMLYDKIPSQKKDSKARNVLGLVQDFIKEKQKYGNPAAYINTFFKSRSKEVINYFVPDAVVESMNDAEGNIKTSVAKKSSTELSRDQGPAARALTDFNDLLINDENFITSDIYKSIKSKIINNITLLLSKGNLDVNSMVEIINKEISNVIKKAQGKISKVDGKVVISNEYNNFVRDGYEGGIKSLPIRVIKDSYLNKLFPSKKLGKVDLQNKKANNPNLKKDSNYRIDKLEIKKPTIGNWVKYFTEGGYTTLLAKQKKYATEIAKAVSLKVTRESIVDQDVLLEIFNKSSLRNEEITLDIVKVYFNNFEQTLDSKTDERSGFDDIQFSKTISRKISENDRSGLPEYIITKLFDPIQSAFKGGYISTVFQSKELPQTDIQLFQSVKPLYSVVNEEKILNKDTNKILDEGFSNFLKKLPSELIEKVKTILDYAGMHHRGKNLSSDEAKSFVKKLNKNIKETNPELLKLYKKINFEHISLQLQGQNWYNKNVLAIQAGKNIKEKISLMQSLYKDIVLKNNANLALKNYLDAKMTDLIKKGDLSKEYVYVRGRLETNIAKSGRALSMFEYIELFDGEQVVLNRNGGLQNKPTKGKNMDNKTYQKKLDEYYNKWKQTVSWGEALKIAKKIHNNEKNKNKTFTKNQLFDLTIKQIVNKNEHLKENSMTAGLATISAMSGTFDTTINETHTTAWLSKMTADKMDAAGGTVTFDGATRLIKYLSKEVSNNIYHISGVKATTHVIQTVVSKGLKDGSIKMSDLPVEVQNEIEFSKTEQSNSDQFNKILEQTKGVDSVKRFSDAAAKSRGAKKGLYDWFIPPSAEDFSGLLYKFLGKGKIGDKQMKFFKDKLINPFASAMAEIDRRKQQMSNEYLALRKKMPGVKKMLGENTGYNEFTYDSAVRVYLWDKAGFEIPGLSKRDQTELVKKIKENADLKLYADTLGVISKLKDGWVKPSESWLGGNIPTDLSDINQKVNRKEVLAEWVKNKNEIFSKENLNKIEAIYGTDFRESLEEILGRMERGSNRPIGSNQNKLTTRFMNWVNNSVGAIMFFNARSAILQTISMANFVNFSDNNIFAASKAFANQKQFWADFTMLFNSDFLKQRRSGLKTDINEAEISNAVGTAPNKATAAFKYMLKKGFLPTQIADSFAIAMGGASFIRNRINSLVESGMTKQEAMDQAMLDFREISEEAQQSSRPDRISSQQAGPLGRVILAFANTPMQYARMQKKAILDLKNGRGDWKTNMSKILYYGVIQNFIFNALQQALFAMAFDDDEEKLEEKELGILNGMADSLLRGTGVAGAGVATVKNMVMELIRQNQKDRPDYVNVALKSTTISPPISSKLNKLVSAARTFQWNGKEIREEGLSLDNPANLAVGKTVSAFTNIPLDRVVQKIDNLKTATEEETAAWQSIALVLGWDQWSLGLNPYQSKKKSSKIKTYQDLLKKRKKSSKKSKYKARK